MRLAYLDCFAGISGDMFLGALLEAGVPLQVLEDATAALNLNASLRVETVDRSGISCTKVHVLEGDHLAEEPEAADAMPHQHTQEPLSAQPKTQHLHKTGHAHTHEHDHSHSHELEEGHEHAHDHSDVHGRSLTVIRALIQAAPLEEPVKAFAIRAFELLGASEAKIHNVPVEQIHFHEVGAVDAIVDIVAASAGIHHLKIGAWHSSPLNVGGGMVSCAHGNFPVPAPATADLLRGLPTYSAHIQKELVTPTGAALIRALAPSFGAQPAMRVEQIGYGAGTRNPAGFPNVLRLSVGESSAIVSTPAETITLLETALDDLSPQIIAYVAEAALKQGALDVMLTPVIMVLCEPAQSDALTALLLRETSTLGVRSRQEQRQRMDRAHVTVQTPYGAIRMKVGSLHGQEWNAAPEFEDCRAAAELHHVALKLVQQAAMAAYTTQG
jgi:uncharacterized protein (TIGR00299 family) protein